ncbi:thiol methyltransferase [Aspergillus affinis]|uniref:thiol methyltransferase n=1 Tax=Aspergillus affinis TaxID=1070780 RepID=UPI0022FE2436|nr:thiol methyltransferase [Aspergillus affinis]KAI9039787.1 thiol methyltransferase [Aspergillus affinis]
MTDPTQNPTEKTRLVRHFDAHDVKDYTNGWSKLWDSNDSNLWDRSKPSPPLIDLIEERRDDFKPIAEDGRRKKALVPGCGKGYDVVMLALHGFDVYGLDVSATGVSTAKEYARRELASPQGYNFGSVSPVTKDDKIGQVTILQGDFFKSDWDDGMKFDLIYDYTFLCALHPSMRAQWASRMAELLSAEGHLVCLEFPLWKDPKLPGPPWGLNGVHWNLLAEGGDGVVEDSFKVEQGSERGLFIRTLYMKPERSYEQGRGMDMLSIYVKKE